MKPSAKTLHKLISVTAALAIMFCALASHVSAAKSDSGIDGLVINEICAKNESGLKAKDGEYYDWIEIYNPSKSAVSLKGAGLSDSDEAFKWVFPDVEIAAGEYLVVYASDLNKTSAELHTNFKISEGETIILTSPAGKKIDSAEVISVANGNTCGRLTDGSFDEMPSTPGAKNAKLKETSSVPDMPEMSKLSGFYDSEFTLSISAEKYTTIYYTTDGSVPTTASKKYSSEISIKSRKKDRAVYTYKRGTVADLTTEQFPQSELDKATVVRAIAVDSNGNKSGVATSVYFVGSDLAKKYKSVSVISVVIDPKDLYDNATGIYVAGDTFTEWRKANPTAELDGEAQGNYNQRGREWERDAHIDFFRNGSLEFSVDCGARTHGGWSRNSQQKSLKFYMRSEYGDSKIKYELFEDNRSYDTGKKIKEYKRFMIRNGGNDSFTLLYKDAWTQASVKSLDFATQDTELVIAFLDGEYWGIYTMTELYDDNYIESNFGVPADDVVMIKVCALEEGLDTDYKLWEDAEKFVSSSDMSKQGNYEKACELFDMDSFCDYIAMEVYIGNEDWIWNNWAVWRSRSVTDKPYQDGKWRFMAYDTEYSMNLYENGKDYKFDIFGELAAGNGHLGPMVKSLLKSDEFKSKLLLSFEDVMNISFNPKSSASLLQKYHSEYAPYMSDHFRRFIYWQSEVGIEQNRNGFKSWLQNRYDYMPQQIAKYLGLSSSKVNELKIQRTAGGTVKINGLELGFTGLSWEGHYFPSYRISIEAVPSEGYEFTGWSGDYNGTMSAITITPETAETIKANFTKKQTAK